MRKNALPAELQAGQSFHKTTTGSASGSKALAMDIIKTPWYIEVEVRQPNKIYQGGPSHEREGHK